MARDKEDRKPDLKQAESNKKLVNEKEDQAEVTLTPQWNENKRSAFSFLIPEAFKELNSFNTDSARVEITKKLSEDESIEWLEQFEFKTLSDMIREFLIALAISIAVILVAPLIGGYLGYDPSGITRTVTLFAGVFLSGLFLATLLSGIRSKKSFIALTNKRIVVTGPLENAWFWSIYAEDILKIETITKYGVPRVAIKLVAGRKTMAHIACVELNGIKDRAIAVEKLENYKQTVATPYDARLDKPAKITKETVKKETGKFFYRSLEIPAGQQIVLGSILFLVLGFLYVKELTHQNWVSTTASITRVEAASHGEFRKYYTLDKHFEYEVDGARYEYIDKADTKYDTKELADKIALKKEPPQMKVYYDPKNPKDSEENPKESANNFLMFALLGLGVAISGFISRHTLKSKGAKQILYGYLILSVCLALAYSVFLIFKIN